MVERAVLIVDDDIEFLALHRFYIARGFAVNCAIEPAADPIEYRASLCELI
jgi:hypothetical protein